MRCDEARSDLAAWLDGELPEDAARSLAAHVESCPSCREERAALEKTIEAVRSLPRAKAPRELAASVFARLGARVPVSVGPAGAGAGCSFLEAGDLSAYVDGELESARRAEIQRHLSACGSCAIELESIQEARERVRVLPRVSAPPSLLAIVMARIEDALAVARGSIPSAQASEPAPEQAPGRKRFGRLSRRAEPIELPSGLKRFLQAASILVLAAGAISLSTPNADSGVKELGVPEWKPAPVGRPVEQGPGTRVDEGDKPPSIDRDRTLVLIVRDADTGRAFLAQAGAYAIGVSPDPGANPAVRSFSLTGTVASLRRYFSTAIPNVVRALGLDRSACALEDPTKAAELLPEPVDRVFCRNGVVYQGKLLAQDRSGVVIAPSGSTGKVSLSSSAVVRVQRAQDDAAEIGLELRERRD